MYYVVVFPNGIVCILCCVIALKTRKTQSQNSQYTQNRNRVRIAFTRICGVGTPLFFFCACVCMLHAIAVTVRSYTETDLRLCCAKGKTGATASTGWNFIRSLVHHRADAEINIDEIIKWHALDRDETARMENPRRGQTRTHNEERPICTRPNQ